tara:strand:+ start:1251 stop:1430 length:180 start_codon:yes stop_codon:yes gene_type:complete
MTMLFFLGNTVKSRTVHGGIPPLVPLFWRQVGAMLLIAPSAHGELRRKWLLARCTLKVR